MKTLLALLLLIPSLTWGNHNKTIDIDYWEFNYDSVEIYFYNKSSKQIDFVHDYNYDFEVIFEDGTKRVYSPEVYLGICKPKTDCIFKIKLNRKDVKNIGQAH